MRNDLSPVSRIVLIRIRENVVGTSASRLADMLDALDPDTPAILDFSTVTSVDGYGINVIADTLARGVDVYLVAVRGRVRRMFRQARIISEGQFVDSVPDALKAIDEGYREGGVREDERRRYPRVRAHIPVEVILDLDGQRIATDGIIKDISEGGVYVELLQKLTDIVGDDLDLSTSLDLRFALPDVTYPCILQGNAVHGGAIALGLCYGVKFNELSYLDEDAIRTFLYNRDPDRRAGSA